MKTKTLISAILMLSGIFLTSCATSYSIDEKFEIELEKNNIGGYQWEYVKIPEIVIIDSVETKTLQENQLNEYLKVYTMKGVQKGRYELVFRKKRSFEPDSLIPTANFKKIKIKITK